jgi:hypothetical protein
MSEINQFRAMPRPTERALKCLERDAPGTAAKLTTNAPPTASVFASPSQK